MVTVEYIFDETTLKMGEYGILKHENKEHIMVCTYLGLISLNNPNLSWSGLSSEGTSRVKVRKIPMGSKITVVVEK